MKALDKKIIGLKRRLKDAMLSDVQAVLEEMARLRSGMNAGKDLHQLDQRYNKAARRLEQSIAACKRRRNQEVRLVFDDSLPIVAKKDNLIEAIQKHQVIIVTGETGSGKTTQLPKFCLAAGRGVRANIGVTQPRRIAAATVSRRIAHELGETLGGTVGYKIRFQDTVAAQTRIKIMTDGILLSEAHKDRMLFQYDTIIVDEAHERSLNIDFILGLLKQLVKKRPDLKIIVTSATIDTQKFSNAFEQAPVISVSGRTYPVDIRWTDPLEQTDPESSHVETAAEAVDGLMQMKASGDVLVFMPTEQDIRDTCELLEGRRYRETIVIPLFARLSAAEQQQVFDPLPMRKIIVATNVAETSITIPGIRFVVDSGLARIPQYTPRSRTTTMPVVPISQSSADQRMGRCGRVANGVCIRLFSEEDYNNRPLFTPPEIVRSNLADVILRMIALKLGNVEDFPFIDPPAAARIQDGYNLLTELGAIRKKPSTGKKATGYMLTPKGRLMARLPLDPRLSRMLIEAHDRGCLDDVAVLAAALSIQDPRERPVEKQTQADAAQARFADNLSDFVALLKIWHAYHQKVKNRSGWKEVKQFCRQTFLSFRRMREWKDVYLQILNVLEEQQISVKRSSSPPEDESDLSSSWYAAVHQSILSGFLSNIALKKEGPLFQASHHREVMIFPGSGLFKKPGNWIVAAEMVETSRLFARCAAVILPEWLETIGKEQCTCTYRDPHWERNRAEVVATEQVNLYGLVIASRKRSYGPINPEIASEIFIRKALVEGDLRSPLPFMEHNASVLEDIGEMEERLRRRDLCYNEDELFEWYQKRLGSIYSLNELKHLIRKRGGDNFLRMRSEQVMHYAPPGESLAHFPDTVQVQGQSIACQYRFSPGSETDGITARVPTGIAGTLNPDLFQWLVPGLLEEKIVALLKALPKERRKLLVPIAETAADIAGHMPIRRDTSLAVALSRFIKTRFNVSIAPNEWDESEIPLHLRMRYALTDDQGRILETSRDAAILKRSPANGTVPHDFKAVLKKFERTDIRQWDFGDLPDSIRLAGPDGLQWNVFPALEKRKTSLVLTAFAERARAERVHPQGVKELLRIQLSSDIKYLRKNLTLPASCTAAARYFGGIKKLEQDLFDRVLDDLLAKPIRRRAEFQAHLKHLTSDGLAGRGQNTRGCLLDLLDHYHAFRMRLRDLEEKSPGNLPGREFLNALRLDMEQVIPENFVSLYDDKRLQDCVRYIKAATIRAERGLNDLEKDRAKQKIVEPVSHAFAELVGSLAPEASAEKRRALEQLFWTLQELKVSIFAQEIKTAEPVSAQKINARIREIQGMR